MTFHQIIEGTLKSEITNQERISFINTLNPSQLSKIQLVNFTYQVNNILFENQEKITETQIRQNIALNEELKIPLEKLDANSESIILLRNQLKQMNKTISKTFHLKYYEYNNLNICILELLYPAGISLIAFFILEIYSLAPERLENHFIPLSYRSSIFLNGNIEHSVEGLIRKLGLNVSQNDISTIYYLLRDRRLFNSRMETTEAFKNWVIQCFPESNIKRIQAESSLPKKNSKIEDEFKSIFFSAE
jgi:hypothetical protein